MSHFCMHVPVRAGGRGRCVGGGWGRRDILWWCVILLNACACEGRREGELCWGGGDGGMVCYTLCA